MAKILHLEKFESLGPAEHMSSLQQSEIEEIRLAAYEHGYKAGWDDAVTAQNDEIARLRADLGHNLTELALNHRDARAHVLGTLEPLLREMVTKVLPEIAHHSLGQIILEHLRPAAEDLSRARVLVCVAPANLNVVRRLLNSDPDIPVRVLAEPTLGDGQAHMKLGESEIQIDLDRVIEAIATAVAAFFETDDHEGKNRE